MTFGKISSAAEGLGGDRRGVRAVPAGGLEGRTGAAGCASSAWGGAGSGAAAGLLGGVAAGAAGRLSFVAAPLRLVCCSEAHWGSEKFFRLLQSGTRLQYAWSLQCCLACDALTAWHVVDRGRRAREGPASDALEPLELEVLHRVLGHERILPAARRDRQASARLSCAAPAWPGAAPLSGSPCPAPRAWGRAGGSSSRWPALAAPTAFPGPAGPGAAPSAGAPGSICHAASDTLAGDSTRRQVCRSDRPTAAGHGSAEQVNGVSRNRPHTDWWLRPRTIWSG